MVFSLLALGVVAGLLALAGISLQIIQPLSMIAAGAIGLILLQWLESSQFFKDVYEGFDLGDMQSGALNVGISVAAAFLVYKIIGWLLVGLGLVTTLLVILVVAFVPSGLLIMLLLNIVGGGE